MLHKSWPIVLLSSLSVLANTSTSLAQTWSAVGLTQNWSNAASWSGGLPVNDGTANVTFAGTGGAAAILDADWNISSLTFSGSQHQEIDGTKTLTLQNGLTSTLFVPNQAIPDPTALIQANLLLPSFQTWNITTGLRATGVISGTGGIVKTGGGLLRLASGNMYSGGTTITGGAVAPVNDTSFGSAGSSVLLNGGSLYFDTSGTTISRNLTLGSSGGTIDFRASFTLASNITGSGSLTLSQNASTPYPSPSSATLSGNNTFTGGLTITNGLYSLFGSSTNVDVISVSGLASSLGAGPVHLSAGTVLKINAASNIAGGNTINLVNNSALIVTSDGFSPAQVISSSSTQGILELSGSTYNRSLDLSALGDGTLTLGVAAGQTVVYGGTSLKPGSGNVYRLGGSVESISNTPLTPLVIRGTDNVLTGSASLQVTGFVNLLNANNYTGGTVVNGFLGIGSDQALGTGQIQLGFGSLTALQGAHILSNDILIVSDANVDVTGLSITGPVNLNSHTFNLNAVSPTSFSNSITNGTFALNGGSAILSGTNQLSALQLNGGTVVVSSEANLGGPNVPIRFFGRYKDTAYSGTLETTASMTLGNPLSFGSSPFGGLNVDAGTTLILSQSVAGGSLLKEGSGTLIFGPGSTLTGGHLEIFGGLVGSTANAFSQSAGVYLFGGGTFAGSGRVGSMLYMADGTVTPAGGHGIIVVPSIASGAASSSALQFDFTSPGSPNYLNLADASNGVLAFGGVGSNSGGAPIHISIFLNAGELQNGEIFKGGLYLESLSDPALLPISFDYTYYLADPNGSIQFDGATFSLLDPAKYAVSQSWVNESANFGGTGNTAGQIEKFQIASVPEPQSAFLLASAALFLSSFRPKTGLRR